MYVPSKWIMDHYNVVLPMLVFEIALSYIKLYAQCYRPLDKMYFNIVRYIFTYCRLIKEIKKKKLLYFVLTP